MMGSATVAWGVKAGDGTDAPVVRARPSVGVGLFLLDGEGRFLLMKRKGSHGEGCWGLVGGHLEHGYSPQRTAADEAMEEVGVALDPSEIALGPYTNDVFPDEGKHYVTLYASARLPVGQTPRNLEPGKCTDMGWFAFDAMPTPLFVPVANFLRQPFRPPFATYGTDADRRAVARIPVPEGSA